MPETHDISEIYETAKAHAGTEEQRAYWRDRQREHRIKKRSLEHASIFTPHITRLALCSYCKKWHAVEAILATGDMPRFSLDSYHSKDSILSFVRGIDVTVPKTAAYVDHATAMDLCMKDLMEQRGYAEDAAREEAKTLIQNDDYRTKLVKFHHDAAVLEHVRNRRLKMCMIGRMEMYKETEYFARLNCETLLADPLYRHMPEGLKRDPYGIYDITGPILVPAQIDQYPWIYTKDPSLEAFRECFTRKMKKNPKMDPRQAIEECLSETRPTKEGEDVRPAVGDLYGKSKAAIAAMTKRKLDLTLTVGDIYGLSRKQRLRMQRLGWDQEDNAAFEKCVVEKMKEGMTRKEAEDICEALSASSADRKLKPIDDGAGVTHIS